MTHQRMCQGHRRYRDKQEALYVARLRMRVGSENAPVFLRAYACPECHGWHLTGQQANWRKPTMGEEEIFIVNEGGDFEIRQRFEPALRKMRFELFGRNNRFLGGTLAGREYMNKLSAFLGDASERRKEGRATKGIKRGPSMRFDPPEVYGPPQLAGRKGPQVVH